MSFREKIHWVALASLILAFGWYFAAYPWDIADTPQGMYAGAGMLLAVAITFLVPMIIGTSYFAIRAPKEAHAREDERDRTIHRQATQWAYYALVIGVWVNVFGIINGLRYGAAVIMLVATVVCCELVRVGAQIWLYRRGA